MQTLVIANANLDKIINLIKAEKL